MAPRFNINQITPDTPDWTCKVQIVDISRERESPEKKIKFQNLILEDEEEQQIRVVLYGDDIGHYEDKLILLQTYLISVARVKVSPTSYGRAIYQFYWIFDRETTVEHVQLTDKDEKPLPPPTKLSITTLDRIAHTSASEIDILGVVACCGPSKYAGRSTKKCRKDAIELNLLYKEFPKYFVWSTTDKMWSRRRRHSSAIGRIVSCHPTEGEKYYLRLLLNNVKGPKSYEDIRTVEGICYDTFREAAEKKRLITFR